MKAITNLDSALKSKDITLPTKVCVVKAMIFPVVMYSCENWVVKKAEGHRIDAFKLWCWRRLLRVPWTARKSNQSILKEINLGYSLEGLMLKLKLQYFGYMMWTANSLEKTLMLEKIEGRSRRGHESMKWLDGITDAMNMNLGKLQEMVREGGLVCGSPWDQEALDSTEWLTNSSLGHSAAQIESGQIAFSIGFWQHPHEVGILIFIVKVKKLRPCHWGVEKWGWDLTPLCYPQVLGQLPAAWDLQKVSVG